MVGGACCVLPRGARLVTGTRRAADWPLSHNNMASCVDARLLRTVRTPAEMFSAAGGEGEGPRRQPAR
jgi:hypothetical protein